MFTSQHVEHVFYESWNSKGITACKCLNINIIRFIRLLLDKEITVRDCDQKSLCSCITLTCWLTLSLCLYSIFIIIIIFDEEI